MRKWRLAASDDVGLPMRRIGLAVVLILSFTIRQSLLARADEIMQR
jgi:hypothetical protein